MAVHTDDINVRKLVGEFELIQGLIGGNSEFAFFQSRRNVGVGLRVDIWIDAQGHTCTKLHGLGNLIDLLKLTR